MEMIEKMIIGELAFSKSIRTMKEQKCTLIGNKKCIGLECGSMIAVIEKASKTPALYCLFAYFMDQARQNIKDNGYELVSIDGQELYFGEGD